MDEYRNNNMLIGLVLLFSIALTAWFFADLLEAKAGERIAAFGGVIGGIVGAGGAVFAVYLTLTTQRNGEIANVRAAVRTEVTTYTKYIIGTLDICEKIARTGLQIPMAEATYIGKNLIDPTIYNAVADRVALLQRPQVIVEFCMRIAEAKSNLNVMQVRASGMTQAQSAMVNVQASNAEVVADSLITALQLGQAILSESDPTRTSVDEAVQRVSLAEIQRALASALAAFPNAESFKTPS